MKDETLRRVRDVYAIESQCIREMEAYLDEGAFSRAVEALARAPRIGTTGCGHSGIACMHFAHLLCCIERPARFLSPAEAIHGASGFLLPGDAMVFASRGGQTAELLPILDICRKRQVTAIVITENMASPLAMGADIALKQHVNRETDRDNAQGTTSTTALCVLFHALQTALLEETDFALERFAQVHPGGAVGRRLNHAEDMG